MSVETGVHATSVAGRLTSMDLTFELDFTIPLFDLPECQAELLRVLHDTLPGPFKFDASDVEISQGTELSGFKMSISVVDGNARIEVSPESLSMSFLGLPNMSFLQPCQPVVDLAHQAVTNSVQDAEVDLISIDVFLRVNLEEEHSAQDHLNDVLQSRFFDFSNLGETLQDHEIKFSMRDKDDSWRVSCHARADLERESLLNVSIFGIYDADDTISELGDETNHLESVVTCLLPQIGVNMK